MSKISDRLRKLADDMMAVDGDLNLTPGSINPEEAADLLDEAEKALTAMVFLAEAEHYLLLLNHRGSGANYKGIMERARATLARIRGEQP
jgi:hypothetical protein